MQYKEYSLIYSTSEVIVRDSGGKVIGRFENDTEAIDYIKEHEENDSEE